MALPAAKRTAHGSPAILRAGPCWPLLAAAWAALGGAGHLFHANGIDWVPRFAVLRDLAVAPWPPRYGAGADAMLLRAPPGYYLPVALLGQLAGLAWLDRLLLAWTWLGVALFFCANFGGRPARGLAAALVFAFASGLDVLGLLWREGSLPWPTQHIEWWAGGMQYSSNSTLLFWVPNHGLPGWIAGAWLWRLRDDPRFLARLPLLFLPVMLWSPLVAVGLLPLAVVAALRHWRDAFRCKGGAPRPAGLGRAGRAAGRADCRLPAAGILRSRGRSERLDADRHGPQPSDATRRQARLRAAGGRRVLRLSASARSIRCWRSPRSPCCWSCPGPSGGRTTTC
jgi:hypothetical protein